ncbi:hypothetical protein Pla123a_46000 [Posidoniimonas polymericola]|uniref:Double zinc ribbon n=1 Tax=Posidoniimonas polymericola TaxID=2528002 RepID=A0A5C5XUX0_9BACT|nr:hypothetical protein [Posidoniimonas polymericola]TWT66714.1 hypothetical protein Pla123a_46000 [Posidoniimonas polymericola]
MDKNLYEQIDPDVDILAGQVTELIDSEACESIKRQLAELSRVLGEYSLTLDIRLQVFDAERGRSLPLLQTGLATSAGNPPYTAWGDSTAHRYVVNGDLAMVPHDHCPACWAEWDFKDRNPACPGCGATMGAEVRLLIDSDCCPSCERGRVTASDPTCSECGFEVNPDHVSWG